MKATARLNRLRRKFLLKKGLSPKTLAEMDDTYVANYVKHIKKWEKRK